MSSSPEGGPGGRSSLSVRLIVSVAALFVAGNAAALAAAYFTLASSLRQRDRAEIQAELQDLRGAYEEGGVAGLRKDAAQAGEQGVPSFVRLTEAGGRKLYENVPPSLAAFGPARLPAAADAAWSTLTARDDEETLEVAAESVKGGAVLQVGQSSARRDDVLERFRWIAAAIFVPTVLLGTLLGLWLIQRVVLLPVRRLHDVVEGVLAGRSGGRVPAGRGRDELERLGLLFNRMLDRIEALISAMKGSLDAVAHDLRTPITRLRAGAEAALRSEADLPACREALADCVEEADRVSTMLTTLMDISEAESGAMTLRLVRVSLDELAAEAAELYRYAAEAKGLRLGVAGAAGASALCDRDRMRQVVANLVDNAVKYTPKDGRVEISTAVRAGEATVSVRDSGPGIPAEELPRVFERLYRGRDARAQRGLGLGLSLVQAVVNAHGGRVAASAPDGGGTLVEVALRAADGPITQP